jgi:hypothetical protein
MDSDDDDVPSYIRCNELRFIGNKMDWGPRMYKLLKKENMTTLNAMCRKRTQLQELMNQTDDADRLKMAIDIVRFREHIQEVHGRRASMSDYFSQNEFTQFLKNQERDADLSLDKYLFGNGPRPDNMTDEDINGFTQKMIPEALKNVQSDCLKQLKSCDFEVEEFVHMLIRCRMAGAMYVVVAGRTQLGKNNVKCLVHGVASVAKVGVIVLTKGNRERDELRDKINDRVVHRNLVDNSSTDENGIADTLRAGGSVVAAQTAAQINRKIIRAVQKCQREDPNFKFIVVLDECDTMIRSRDHEEPRVQVEQAYRDLLKLSPLVVVMISATVVPILLHLVDKKDVDQREVQFFNLKPHKDYISIEMMVPPQGRERQRRISSEDDHIQPRRSVLLSVDTEQFRIRIQRSKSYTISRWESALLQVRM